jgi:hypothetical protein
MSSITLIRASTILVGRRCVCQRRITASKQAAKLTTASVHGAYARKVRGYSNMIDGKEKEILFNLVKIFHFYFLICK